MSNRKLILYISMSLDGFIATKDDDISWLDVIDHTGETYGYPEFVENVDTYIVGRATYDVVLKLTGGKFEQSEKFDCYVITRQKIENKDGITFYNGDIEELINELKSKPGKNIYCDGGGQVVKLLMDKNLIDEYIISIIPIILGDGKKLFIGGTPTINLKELPATTYKSGLVQLHYVKL